tara:strand:- start:1430 stop:1945 length:516 start_codon:yes stop_codon:yes gene_type:complete
METIKALREKGEFAGNVFLGGLYTYKYRALPERSNDNPYFDRFPTTIVTHKHDSKTFDGINFNHIDVERRAELLDALKPFFVFRNNKNYFNWKEYNEVKHLRMYRFAYVCLRRYRLRNCIAGIVKVRDSMWNEVIMERGESFFSYTQTGAMSRIKSESVWLDSIRKTRIIK